MEKLDAKKLAARNAALKEAIEKHEKGDGLDDLKAAIENEVHSSDFTGND